MNNIVQNISIVNLSLAFIPVFVVIAIIWRWNIGYKATIYAVFRMLVQLLLIGYVLTYIFQTNSNYIVITMLLSCYYTTRLAKSILYFIKRLSNSMDIGIAHFLQC